MSLGDLLRHLVEVDVQDARPDHLEDERTPSAEHAHIHVLAARTVELRGAEEALDIYRLSTEAAERAVLGEPV